MTQSSTLEREFLEVRSKIIQLGAALDRIDRCELTDKGDPRIEKIRSGIAELLESDIGRAERIQLIFSRGYDARWQQTFNIASTKS